MSLPDFLQSGMIVINGVVMAIRCLEADLKENNEQRHRLGNSWKNLIV